MVNLTTRIKLGLNAILDPLGLEVITTVKRRNDVATLKKLTEKAHWSIPRYSEGLQIDETKCLEFLSRTCTPFKSEFEKLSSTASSNTGAFYLNNTWFGSVDAELLYSMIRACRPRETVEVGSGFSTRLIRMAIDHGNLSTRLTSIDPQPRVDVDKHADECIRKPVEDLEPATIADRLDVNDILFIDSSHFVRTGGDVPFLFLEVLPRVAPGVYVHIHDIFVPFDYPEKWVREGRDWTEQYLVQSFLAYNSDFEIVWPASYMWKNRQSDVRKIIEAPVDCPTPSSLWIRRIH
jgi:predicted O-methyltransferase YrrM